MYDVVTIGAALVDAFIRSDHFQLRPTDDGVLLCQTYGDKLEVEQFELHSGGGGSNTAAGFSRLGFSTAIVAEMGRDMLGDFVMGELQREHVSTSMMVRERSERTGGAVILIGQDGGRSVMVHRGASSCLDPEDLSNRRLRAARWFHLSNIAGRQLVLEKIFTLAAAHDIGLSWNPGKAELALLADGQMHVGQIPVRILLVNTQEWERLEPVHNQLLRHVPQIVITDGSNGGSLMLGGIQAFSYKAAQAQSLDDTGAGDAFATGYVAAHIVGKGPETCVKWGKANASSVVQHLGAKPGLLTRAEIEKIDGTRL